MALMQGSGYRLEVPITDCEGAIVSADVVTAGSFTFESEGVAIVKRYEADGSGEVEFDAEKGVWIVPLSERDTFGLRGIVKWQARFMFADGMPDGTVPKSEYLLESVDKTEFGGGDENA